MAKYDVTDRYGRKIGEVRSTPDYEQQAINAVGNVAGVGSAVILELLCKAVFARKLIARIVLFVITLGVGGGKGAFLLFEMYRLRGPPATQLTCSPSNSISVPEA